ncbi:MAG TPA: pyridoxal phosphate-dependent aminotransferase [Bryobacteraceae bacterium]|nr:pyridoxal phosphate-dependent aminotransferase [Bryobacteraceae bacterium]
MQTVTELAQRISLISESSTMKVAAEADRLRREGVDVVDFSAGEPDFPTPDNIKRAAMRALDENFTKYTPVGGTVELKQAICDHHRRLYGTSYGPKECIATMGGKHAIFNLTQALVDPDDEVIIPLPYWVTFKDVVNYAGGRCVFAETNEEDGFALKAAAVERLITPRTKLMILNSPCNPSGAVIERSELEKIFRIAKSNGILIISDECYERFLYEGEPFSLASLPGAKDTVMVAGSLSKTYAMTGWRLGFVLAPAEIVAAINKVQSHATSNPASITQKAAIEALRGPQESVGLMLAEYRRRREYVLGRLAAIPGIRTNAPQGAFYVYPNISAAFGDGIANSLQFSEKLLAEEFVALVPGEAFGTDRHVRISYATSMKELERGLDRIARFIQARP